MRVEAYKYQEGKSNYGNKIITFLGAPAAAAGRAIRSTPQPPFGTPLRGTCSYPLRNRLVMQTFCNSKC
jgi:hypothetical protein